MKVIRGCILFLLVFSSASQVALAQWQSELKNVLRDDHNVVWILQYAEDISTARTVEAEIRVRRPGTFQEVLHKSVRLNLGDQKWFYIPLTLPPSVYEIEIEIYDELLEESFLLAREELFLVNEPGNLRASDIFISASADRTEAFLYPILSENIPQGLDTVYYFMELRSDRNISVNSAEFFYESADGNSPARGEISLFASLQDSLRSIDLVAGEIKVLTGYVPVSDYQEGAYLLEVTIEYGVSSPLQETIGFFIGSNLQQKIYADLDHSIRQMVYVVPRATLDELLDSPTEEARLIEFHEAWEDLYQGRYEEEMENYYRRIYEADRRFGTENSNGWQTDRARAFMMYGEPGKVESIELNGKTCERWVYPQWSLMLLFEYRNQDYWLVE